jgi:hypothetical protein
MVDITTLFQREYLRRVHLPVALGPSAWALLGFEEHRDIYRKTSGKDRPFRPFSFSRSANNCHSNSARAVRNGSGVSWKRHHGKENTFGKDDWATLSAIRGRTPPAGRNERFSIFQHKGVRRTAYSAIELT